MVNSSKRRTFSIRSIFVLISLSAVCFAYVAACRRADRTPRTVFGSVVTAAGEPIANAIVVASNATPLPSSSPTEVLIQFGDAGLIQPAHVMRPDDKLIIENTGIRDCCIHTRPTRNLPISRTVKPGVRIKLPIDQAEKTPFTVSGTTVGLLREDRSPRDRPDVHGWVLPTEHPSCVTNERGEYQLPAMLPGKCFIEIFDQKHGRTRRRIRIPRFSKTVSPVAP